VISVGPLSHFGTNVHVFTYHVLAVSFIYEAQLIELKEREYNAAQINEAAPNPDY
jgi:hypothetical protein